MAKLENPLLVGVCGIVLPGLTYPLNTSGCEVSYSRNDSAHNRIEPRKWLCDFYVSRNVMKKYGSAAQLASDPWQMNGITNLRH